VRGRDAGEAEPGVAAVRRAVVPLAGVAAVGVAAVLLAGGDTPEPAPAAAASTATAAVERRDLVDRESVGGTLGYDGAAPLGAAAVGTVTALPEPGSVVRRGRSLYEADGEPAAWLFYGALPAWRDLGPGIADGEDVRQLERNLRALGHDPDDDMTVDDEWTWATTAAVQRFQDDRGLTEDGTLAQGEVVFRSGPARVGELSAALGQRVAPGASIAQLSTTRRIVTVDLEATRQQLARKGDRVTVELPGGRMARGRITEVGKVAEQGAAEDAEPTIEVTIALRGRGSGLDQAPVEVGFESERREGVLVVPVTALLARAGGGFAVEAEGGKLLDVEPGEFADDAVEVAGDGLREGLRVVVPE
jgi:peptidoglycan hydrolase-like protein with peptidoglycan-binding domain